MSSAGQQAQPEGATVGLGQSFTIKPTLQNPGKATTRDFAVYVGNGSGPDNYLVDINPVTYSNVQVASGTSTVSLNFKGTYMSQLFPGTYDIMVVVFSKGVSADTKFPIDKPYDSAAVAKSALTVTSSSGGSSGSGSGSGSTVTISNISVSAGT